MTPAEKAPPPTIEINHFVSFETFGASLEGVDVEAVDVEAVDGAVDILRPLVFMMRCPHVLEPVIE